MKYLTRLRNLLRGVCVIKTTEDAVDKANKQMDEIERHVMGRAHMDGDDRFCILIRRPPNGGCVQ
jgi:hypothetical protein